MDSPPLIRSYEKAGALLQGHFLLRSGMHTDCYLQSAIFLSNPDLATIAGEAIAGLIQGEKPELVIAPAVGGIVIGQEVARALGCRALFAERTGDSFALRRGFEVGVGERVGVIEDIVTTGGSVKLVLEMIERLGGRPVAVGALIDRSGGRAHFAAPFHSLAALNLNVFTPDRCPLCAEGLPLEKPGSRGLGA